MKSHIHRLQTDAQELVAIELRKLLKLTPDDLLVVVREFLNPDVSRAGLARCLRCHGLNHLRDLEPVRTTTSSTKLFKTTSKGVAYQ